MRIEGDWEMKAFYGITELKEHYLGRLKWHMDMDHLVRGVGWESNGKIKGCAVGCSLEKYNHDAFEMEWGIPKWLGKMDDVLFERMTSEKSKSWPYEFAEAITVGGDYTKIFRPWLIIICESVLEYVQDDRYRQQKEAIEQVIRALKGNGDPGDAAWAAWAAGAAAGAAAGVAAGHLDRLALVAVDRP